MASSRSTATGLIWRRKRLVSSPIATPVALTSIQVEHGDFKIVLEYQEFSPTLVHRSFTLINKTTKTVG